MPYTKIGYTILKLAPGLDALDKLSLMHGGPATPTFYDETKRELYNRVGEKYSEFGYDLEKRIKMHPFTRLPLFEDAYLCPYCLISNCLSIYHHALNCNVDHNEPWAELSTKPPFPEIAIVVREFPGTSAFNLKLQAAMKHGLKQDREADNVFLLDWTLKTHRQLIYNDLNNLEITCHGHNRLKGSKYSRTEAVTAAILLDLNRQNAYPVMD